MSCVLRVFGKRFDVDRYLARSPFRPCGVHRRGEPVAPLTQPNGRKRTQSGCNIEVSKKDFADFAGSIRDAIRFLRKHGPAVRALRRFAGVEWARLDFGVEWCDVIYQCDVLPEALVVLAGRCRLGLEISHYPVATRRSDTRRAASYRRRSHTALYKRQKQDVREAYVEFRALKARSKRSPHGSGAVRTVSGTTKSRRTR